MPSPSRLLVRHARHVLPFLLLPSIAHAQVNTEPFRKRIKETGYSFILQGTFDGHTGNTQGLTADGLVGGGLASGRHLAFAFASIDYSKLNQTLGVDKSFVHARYDYAITRRVSWEVFVQEQSDVFQLIKTRDLIGTGPRFAIYDDPHLGIFLGVAYMAERDVYDLTPGSTVGSTDDRLQGAQRASLYLSAHATLSDGIDTVTTTYAQPNLTDPSDIRILSESGFVFRISTRFSTSISFVAHYDSNPVPGVLPTDTELKNAITLTL
jgi:hypothetical protein